MDKPQEGDEIHGKNGIKEENGSNGSCFNDKKGGVKTMPFILANDISEKLAIVGFARNMVNYLTQQLHMPITTAANTVTNFNGSSSLTPLIGAFIADSYAGKFWTITLATTIYLLGMISLTLSAELPQLRPPPCQGNQVCKEADSTQKAVLYISLLLAAIGAGGIKPCVAPFGADQFVDEDSYKQTRKTCMYFNWYYFSMEASTLVAATVLVYVQDNVGWGWGLGIPTIAMALSIIPFVIGYPLYINLDPAGSPYVRMLQVCVAAFRKRKVSMVPDPKLLYVNEELDASISADGFLHHTKQLKCLDKAATVTEEDDIRSSEKPNLWRVSTVHRVEEVKSLIRLLPIWAAGIVFTTSSVQQTTFSVQQANSMQRHLTNSFQIPSASMTVFSSIAMLNTIAFYDRVFVPLTRRVTGLNRDITLLQRMAVGFFISILATLVAGFIEVKRKHVASANGLIDQAKSTIPISVFWLVPQYSLHGAAEGLYAVARLEFFYDQAPESMRSTATALYWIAIAAGNYTSTLLVTLVHKFSAGTGGSNWLPNKNLNHGKLEYFYWLLTVLQALNFVYYIICSKFYTSKPLDDNQRIERGNDHSKDEAQVELVN